MQLLPAEPSLISPATAGKTCTLNSDCQSGTCEDGRCGEAKFCATRYLYDNLGVDIQLRTFDGKVATLGPHQEPIKCGQCVCRDCPVSARPGRRPHCWVACCAQAPAWWPSACWGDMTWSAMLCRAGRHHLLHVHPE